METLHAKKRFFAQFLNTPTKKLTAGENHSGVSICELKSFISLQYPTGLYGQNNHFIFFMIKLIFSETMSHGRFTAFLKYKKFDDKMNRRCIGADRFTLICVLQ